MARTNTASRQQFEARERFNWGYHDGGNSAVKGNRPYLTEHYDSVYLAGYQAGFVAGQNGQYDSQTACSDQAWEDYARYA